ncbi:MAG: hypothetical protein NVS9B14_19820 [Candidatus Acidiferrum sp.]
MNDRGLKEFGETLRAAMPPLNRTELTRDLWPSLLQKFNEPQVRVPWFDWALAALAAVTLVFFPGVIPALLYHL